MLTIFAGTALQIIFVDPSPQVLDIVARQRVIGNHHLEPVVVGRIVAPGHRDAAARVQMLRGEIRDRRCDHAEIDHVGAGSANAVAQRSAKLGSRQSPVAPDGDRVASALSRQTPERLSDDAHDGGRQCLSDNSANVVGLEDFWSDGHQEGEAKGVSKRLTEAMIPGRPVVPIVLLHAVREKMQDALRKPGETARRRPDQKACVAALHGLLERDFAADFAPSG